MMRERFDSIFVLDLRGDVRTGVRANVEADQGVFDIMVGTAITIAIANGSKKPGTLAPIRYADCWSADLAKRRAKLDWLESHAESGAGELEVEVKRGALDDFRPKPFGDSILLSLRKIFSFSKSGMKSGDNDSFIKLHRADLFASIAPKLQHRHDSSYQTTKERLLIFGPLDRRWFYNDLALLQRPGPQLQAAWGEQNCALQALKSGTGAGPAAWCNALLPDYDSFNRRGGYAFPLYDRRAGPSAYNLSPTLIAHLSEAYGAPVSPEDVFDAILALLSATSYTRRFAEDLEDTFPHVPFPALKDTFDRAVAIGRDIRTIETFARPPAAVAGLAKLETQTQDGDVVQAIQYREGEIVIAPEGRGRLSGIPAHVWGFAVSGYRVLPRWIDGRKGQPATLAFIRELRDVAARIHELIHHFNLADLVLADTLAHTLTRAELGFGDETEHVEPAEDD
jgi:hypothetical protein